MTTGEYGEPQTEVHVTEAGYAAYQFQQNELNTNGLTYEAQALLETFADEPTPEESRAYVGRMALRQQSVQQNPGIAFMRDLKL